MSTLVLYFSKYGHTQMVAEAVARVLESTLEVRLLSFDRITVPELRGATLIVAGSPTHKMNMPNKVRPMIDAWPKGVLSGTPVAAFDTSYKMNAVLSRFTAAKKLLRKLRKIGGKRILPPETFLVMGREGPLFEGELERAGQWAAEILAQLGGSIST